MKSTDSSNDMHSKLQKLEASVERLLQYCSELSEENENYKSNNHQLMLERSELQTKNDKVRSQVKAMVDRLKTLDKVS